MPSPQVPKYQAIYGVLREQILGGELEAGSRLPPQQEMAASFGVTLMTLRQAVAALESDGLVWAARGRGTFVSERPVDITVSNLSSFAQQMRAAGVAMVTELLGVAVVPRSEHPEAYAALETHDELCCITRRRLVGGEPFSLQRSFLGRDLGVAEPGMAFLADSLYDEIEDKTGWTVARATESVTAVLLGEDADALGSQENEPAVLSIRTSINQFGTPFLYDEALLVGGRCIIDRRPDRTSAPLAPLRRRPTSAE